MSFWTIAFNRGWVTIEKLKKVVITETNPYGEITPEQYKEITGSEYTQ